MSLTFATVRSLAVTTGKEIAADDVPSLAAAIAYYTVFSLPPLLVVVVGVAGAVFGPDRVTDALAGQVGGLVGPDGRAAVEAMIVNASDVGAGIGGKLAGLAALLFGASGAFGELQRALNRAWEVEAAPGGGLAAYVGKRLLSFGLVLTIAFLLLVSLAIGAFLSALGAAAEAAVGGAAAPVTVGPLLQVVNAVVSLGVITALFAVMFKVLPDAEIAWRDVAVGAFATALLFTIGKTLIGLYLGTADPGSAFGAAGSLALILVWIYYSALILLAGAEFTQAWAVSRGGGIAPSGGAVAVADDAPDALSGSAPPAGVMTETTDPATGSAGFSIEDASSGRTR